jgi:hypothetical protein
MIDEGAYFFEAIKNGIYKLTIYDSEKRTSVFETLNFGDAKNVETKKFIDLLLD